MTSEMEKLLMEEEKNYQEVYKGSIVRGVVMIEKEDSFYIDLNYKTDGMLPKDQILESESIKVGDEVEVQVIKIDKNTGDILLSKKRVDEFKVWDEVHNGDILNVKVVEYNAKGLIAAYKGSLRGFIPLSHIELKFIGEEALKGFMGQTFDVEIIDIDPKKRRLIFSRKNILLKEQEKLKNEIIDQIKEGEVFEGIVKDIKEYGIFVDIGGFTGLVHVSEISWDRNDNIKEMFSVGQKVNVQVISFDKNTQRLSLSIKALIQHPWEEFMSSHNVGDIIDGEVKNIKEYGAFINLYPTVDGFVHISNLSSDFIKNPNEILKVGQKANVKIISIDPDSKKIELSLILEDQQAPEDQGQESNEETSNENIQNEEVQSSQNEE